MNEFTELIKHFNLAKASNNEKLLLNAVTALVTITERQAKEIRDLEHGKEDREPFYG